MGFNPAIVNVLELVKEAMNIIIRTTNSTLSQYIPLYMGHVNIITEKQIFRINLCQALKIIFIILILILQDEIIDVFIYRNIFPLLENGNINFCNDIRSAL